MKRALLELIADHDYDRITVEEIAERADIGRSTFYSHYSSKDELLFDGFAERFIELAQAAPRGDGIVLGYSLPMLEHMVSQRRFFRATILRGGRSTVRLKLLEVLASIVRAEIEVRGEAMATPGDWRPQAAAPAQPQPVQVDDGLAHGLAGAFIGLSTWWLEQSPRLSPAEVDALYQRIASGALPSTGG